VLVVNPAAGKASGAWKILFATDGSEQAAGTGTFLATIPFPAGTEVTVLYASPSTYMDIPEHLYAEVNDRIKDAVARMKEAEYRHAEEVVERARISLGNTFVKVEVMVREADPAEAILATAESLQANLIAVGSSGMRGVKGMLGSVSRSILGHADRSVLIGKR
jgi:nucleotide-binding universal stress UspA family protein